MFTIKVLRRNASGAERINLISADSVQIYGGGEDWLHGNARAIIYQDRESGSHPCITISGEKAQDDDHWPAHVAYIETAEGKTTEVVRPVGA